MGAKHTETIHVAAPSEQAFELVQRALTNSGFKIASVDATTKTIRAKKGISLSSWGNTIDVAVQPGGADAANHTAVSATSASPGFQLMDWGSNRKIVEKFKGELAKLAR